MHTDAEWEFDPSKFPRPSDQLIELAFRDLIRAIQHQTATSDEADSLIDLESIFEVACQMNHGKAAVDYALRVLVDEEYVVPRYYVQPISAFGGHTGLNIKKAGIRPREKLLKFNSETSRKQHASEPIREGITLSDMARLGMVPMGTVRNWSIEDRCEPIVKHKGSRSAVFSYRDLRMWFVKNQPDKEHFWPEDYSKARANLAKMSK